MNSDYTMLITEREPIIYLEHAKVMMKDGKLTAFFSDGNREVIPPISTQLLLLGAGTSITQASAIFCARNNLYLCFARGGCYIHSIWQGGRWSAPEKIVKQSLLHNSPDDRLRIAKQIIKLKMIKDGVDYAFVVDKLEKIKSINKLMSFEATQYKKLYKELSLQNNIEQFKRIHNSSDSVNCSLDLLNNALYGYCTAVIIQFGMHPSIGFIHGKTRRGGLAFDLADIFKYKMSLIPSFTNNCKLSHKEMMIDFSNRLKENRFRLIREMIYVLRYIAGEIDEEKLEVILDEYSSF